MSCGGGWQICLHHREARAPYTVPDQMGLLASYPARLRAGNPWRPSHLHYIVKAPGFQPLVTEIFPDDDPYIDQDAVFGVREDLLVHYERKETVDPADQAGLSAELVAPYSTVEFDIRLAPEA